MMRPEVQVITVLLTFLVILLAVTWMRRRRYQRLLATVPVALMEDFCSRHLDNCRDITILLPPDYASTTERRYPSLYLNDGQDLGGLKMRQTLAALYARNLIVHIIVVAIPAGTDRLQEYGTAIAPNDRGLGKRAAAYSSFVCTELIPAVDARFRTLKTADRRAILGTSLGGLSAFDIAWNNGDLFRKVGVFSGSFWWRAARDEERIRPGELIMPEVVHSGGRAGHRLKAWFQAGTRDEVADRDQNGVIDAIQDTLQLVDALERAGFQRGKDVNYVEVQSGRHDYDTWSAVLPDFLIWAFPASNASSRDEPGREGGKK